MEKNLCVYILASDRNDTLYVGVTSDLIKRVWEHKQAVVAGFTKEYGVKQLVWYEQHVCADAAITREKQIKKWNRALEGATDRGNESVLERPVPGNRQVKSERHWAPAFAGATKP